jgi:hypothetical protein
MASTLSPPALQAGPTSVQRQKLKGAWAKHRCPEHEIAFNAASRGEITLGFGLLMSRYQRGRIGRDFAFQD